MGGVDQTIDIFFGYPANNAFATRFELEERWLVHMERMVGDHHRSGQCETVSFFNIAVEIAKPDYTALLDIQAVGRTE